MSVLALRLLNFPGHAAALKQAFDFVRTNRPLIFEMTRRELLDRYAGNAFGALWTLLAPMLIIGANLLAYLFIFKIRMPGAESGASYAAFVLSAMTPWMALTDAIGRGPTVILNSASLVKQIVFPSEVLPIKIVLASLPTLLIGVTLCAGVGISVGVGSAFGLLVLLPLALIFYIVMISGMVFALAAFGVFLRDVKDVVGVSLSVGLFIHPIFYPPKSVPALLDGAFHASPISYLLWCFRDALFYGQITYPIAWIVTPLFSVFFLASGWRVYRMLRPTFGNVL